MSHPFFYLFLEYRGRQELFKIVDEILNYQSLDDSIKGLFTIQGDFNYCVDNAIISRDDICDFLISKRSCFNLKVEIKECFPIENVECGTLDINSIELKNFMLSDPMGKIYLDVDGTKPKYRFKIIELAVQFLIKKAGEYPNSTQKIALVHAIFSIYPNMKELTFDVILKCVASKIKNMRRSVRDTEKDAESRKRKHDQNATQQKNELIEKQSTEELIRFLQNCDVRTDDEKIMRALKETLSFRLDEIEKDKDKKLNIKEKYNFFVQDPKYILDDFTNRYPSHGDNFFINFEMYRDACVTLYEQDEKTPMVPTGWGPEIDKMMIVFFYFKTPHPKGKSAYTSKEMLDAFISFRKIGDEETVDQVEPIIIATGSSRMAVTKYQIHFEYFTFDLPSHFTMNEVIDMMFKVCYIFRVNFPKILSEFYMFLKLKVFVMPIVKKVKKDALTNRSMIIFPNLNRIIESSLSDEIEVDI